MLHRKISPAYLIVSAIVGGALTYFAFSNAKTGGFNSSSTSAPGASASASSADVPCNYTLKRLEGYKYIRPVFSAEPECESKKMLGLKSSVNSFLETMKNTGDLSAASVYVKDLSENKWIDLNSGEQYHMGSLFKVTTMMTFLKMAETDPAILDKQVVFVRNNKENPPTQTFNSRTIEVGKSYSIGELLHYMVAYSDNNATMLLHHYMKIDVFEKIFTDLGIAKPDVHNPDYAISVQDYAKFFKVIYDASYLSIKYSDYAISLLNECDFKKGILSGLPADITVAHKFGEAGNSRIKELHESAIVYLENKPYLVVIMTKGKDVNTLAGIIGQVSHLVYEQEKALK